MSDEHFEGGEWFTPDALARRLASRPEEFAPAFRVIWQTLQSRRQEC
jgi:hypothetical protein